MVSATASRPEAPANAAPSRSQLLARRLRRIRVGRLGLRARITLSFALGALILSSLLAGVTFAVVRSTVVRQREDNAIRQAYVNASTLAPRLAVANPDVQGELATLSTPTGARPLVVLGDRWTPLDPRFSETVLPLELRDRVTIDRTAARMRTTIDGNPVLAIGLPLQSVDASYFEIASLEETASTIRSLGVSLLGASILTTALGVLLGIWASRRAVRPLAEAASAATAIAGGELDTRLDTPDDKDLRLLASAFNGMAAALEARVERDARFASDVSHELRSPLMTLSASTEVLQSNREGMPPRAAAALELLVGDVKRFQGMVEDLLEMSRYDAGAIRLHREELQAAEFVRQAVIASGHGAITVEVSPLAEGVVIEADKRRLARVLQNLLDNASIHGEGDVELHVEAAGDDIGAERVRIIVEDWGPGVPEEERARVFERFARGTNAGRRGMGEGAGLGLALVDESVRLHGGRVWVEGRADGDSGARFVIDLPAVTTP